MGPRGRARGNPPRRPSAAEVGVPWRNVTPRAPQSSGAGSWTERQPGHRAPVHLLDPTCIFPAVMQGGREPRPRPARGRASRFAPRTAARCPPATPRRSGRPTRRPRRTPGTNGSVPLCESAKSALAPVVRTPSSTGTGVDVNRWLPASNGATHRRPDGRPPAVDTPGRHPRQRQWPTRNPMPPAAWSRTRLHGRPVCRVPATRRSSRPRPS